MSMIEINWHPNRKELRNFGKIALIALTIISLLLYAIKGLEIQWVAILFAIGLIIFLTSLISVKLTRIIYLVLILVTLPIGWIVSHVLLAAFYFMLITPLGLLFRLTGRDPLSRRFEPGAKSYWGPHRLPDKLERYFNQF